MSIQLPDISIIPEIILPSIEELRKSSSSDNQKEVLRDMLQTKFKTFIKRLTNNNPDELSQEAIQFLIQTLKMNGSSETIFYEACKTLFDKKKIIAFQSYQYIQDIIQQKSNFVVEKQDEIINFSEKFINAFIQHQLYKKGGDISSLNLVNFPSDEQLFQKICSKLNVSLDTVMIKKLEINYGLSQEQKEIVASEMDNIFNELN
jgi:hypothetical protein